jgi:hypothetical protein
MNEELKPCPFCGREKPSIYQSGGYWKVKCIDGCSLSISGYDKKLGAVMAWNRRPGIQNELSFELEIMTAERDALARENLSQKITIRESTDMLIKAADELTRMKSETYCAYCGERFQLDDDVASRVSEHIRACQKHPMRKVEAERDALLADLTSERHHYAQSMERLNNLVGPEYWGKNLIDAVENEFKKRDAARAEVGMKQDALNSYAEFYDKISRVLGYGDVLPGSATDDAIIMRICQGKELMAENVRLREAQRWISVGERLPTFRDRVLMFMANEYRMIGTFYVDHWTIDAGVRVELGNVTHWMPLPEPQAEVKP